MTIRKANVDDGLSIKTLIASLAHYYLDNKNSTLPEWFSNSIELPEITRRLTDNNYVSFVYPENGQIIGYICLKGNDHVYHLFVDREYQGQGIARRLWQRILSHSTATKITVRSSIYAVPVYEKLGFKVTAPQAMKDGMSFQSMEWVENSSL